MYVRKRQKPIPWVASATRVTVAAAPGELEATKQTMRHLPVHHSRTDLHITHTTRFKTGNKRKTHDVGELVRPLTASIGSHCPELYDLRNAEARLCPLTRLSHHVQQFDFTLRAPRACEEHFRAHPGDLRKLGAPRVKRQALSKPQHPTMKFNPDSFKRLPSTALRCPRNTPVRYCCCGRYCCVSENCLRCSYCY